MNWREKRYYILEMRYRKNGFLMDEVEYYRSEDKARQKCEELSAELATMEDVLMINKPFVGKGCHRFESQEVYYTLSEPRRPMAPERKQNKNDTKGLLWLFRNVV